MEVREFKPGTPCWAGVRSPDPSASTVFYSGLFGWTATPVPTDYTLYSLRGKAIAGAGPMSFEFQRPSWCTYIGVGDADQTVLAATQAGATALVEPFDVPGMGRVAVLADPAGAEFWIWRPHGFTGTQVVGEPGTVWRHALAARDVDAAKAFYGEVFGPHTASMCRPASRGEANDGAEWLVSFAVEDGEAVATKAKELGGASAGLSGDTIMLTDPHGARCLATVSSGDDALSSG